MNVHYFVMTNVQMGYVVKSSVSTHNCIQSFCTDNTSVGRRVLVLVFSQVVH